MTSTCYQHHLSRPDNLITLSAELDPTHLTNNPYDLDFDLTPYM